MKRNVSVVHLKFRCDIIISDKIIKEITGSLYIIITFFTDFLKEELLLIFYLLCLGKIFLIKCLSSSPI